MTRHGPLDPKELSEKVIDLLLRRLRDPRLSILEQYREFPERVRYIEHVPDEELRRRLKNGYRALVTRAQM